MWYLKISTNPELRQGPRPLFEWIQRKNGSHPPDHSALVDTESRLANAECSDLPHTEERAKTEHFPTVCEEFLYEKTKIAFHTERSKGQLRNRATLQWIEAERRKNQQYNRLCKLHLLRRSSSRLRYLLTLQKRTCCWHCDRKNFSAFWECSCTWDKVGFAERGNIFE